jgi:hypothetical protein
VLSSQGDANCDRWAHAAHVIDDLQDAEAASVNQAVGEEIEAPPLEQLHRRQRQDLGYPRQLLAPLCPNPQSRRYSR